MRLGDGAVIDTKIQTLLTLAKIGSYTKTAAALSLTQPAVSHQIKLLEQEYGIKIFSTSKKKLRPTPEGKILIEYAKKVAALSDKAKQAIEDYQLSIHRFTFGITTTLGEYFMPRVLEAYCKEHPEIHISVVNGPLKKLYNMLKTYEIDLAMTEGNIPSADLTSILLTTDYLCLIVSPKHEFAKKKSVSLSDLKSERFILRSQKSGTRTLFENHLLSHGEHIDNFNIVVESDDITTIKELVASNVGISVLASSICKKEIASGKLVAVPITNLNMIRDISIVYKNDFVHTEIVDDIIRIFNKSF